MAITVLAVVAAAIATDFHRFSVPRLLTLLPASLTYVG